MIYDALLVPKESPPTLREIKRALLTYDKVVLVDPSDRDVIPTNAFMSTIIGMPLLGIDMGPVRPMGKTLGYDDQFSRTVELARDAISEGLIEVRRTYQNEGAGKLTIGAVLTGGYPLDTRFVFWLYRAMASDPSFLRDSVLSDSTDLVKELDASPELSLSGRGDGGINDIPALPLLDIKLPSEDARTALTNISRSRLASFVKYAGYCEAKSLVPVFSYGTYGGIAQRLINNASEVLTDRGHDEWWSKRNHILELCHEEFLVDQRLDQLSIREVVRLRTTAWGRQAKAREGLFGSVYTLCKEIGNSEDFKAKAIPLIQAYRKSSEELVRERKRLAFELKCDIGVAVLGGGTGLIGLLSQLASPAASIGMTLAAGGMWALDKAKSYVPALKALRAKEAEMKRGAGFGLHDFYSRLRG